ncbi:hypothetical protein D3C81_1222000 [compost metagenome]
MPQGLVQRAKDGAQQQDAGNNRQQGAHQHAADGHGHLGAVAGLAFRIHAGGRSGLVLRQCFGGLVQAAVQGRQPRHHQTVRLCDVTFTQSLAHDQQAVAHVLAALLVHVVGQALFVRALRQGQVDLPELVRGFHELFGTGQGILGVGRFRVHHHAVHREPGAAQGNLRFADRLRRCQLITVDLVKAVVGRFQADDTHDAQHGDHQAQHTHGGNQAHFYCYVRQHAVFLGRGATMPAPAKRDSSKRLMGGSRELFRTDRYGVCGGRGEGGPRVSSGVQDRATRSRFPVLLFPDCKIQGKITSSNIQHGFSRFVTSR